MKRAVIITILAAGMSLSAGLAMGMTGNDVLDKVETALTGAKDVHGVAAMKLGNLDGSGTEEREIEMWMAGKQKRLVRFLKPKGISMLVLDDSEMYVYLSSKRKIRRISGGEKNDDFQGTDFSYDEIGSYEYKKDYTAEIQSEDDKNYVLKLTRKEGSEKLYDKMIMWVSKSDFVPNKGEMYEGDKLVKVLVISDTHKEGSYITPSKIRIENRVKNHFTEMTMKNIEYDKNLEAEDVFTQRYLKKD